MKIFAGGLSVFLVFFGLAFGQPGISMAQRRHHGGRHREERATVTPPTAEEAAATQRAQELVNQAQRATNPGIAAVRYMEAYEVRPSICALLFNAGGRFEAAAAIASDVNDRRSLLERARDAFHRYHDVLGVAASCSLPADQEDAAHQRRMLDEGIARVEAALAALTPPPPAPAPPAPALPPPPVPVVVAPRFLVTRPVRGSSVGLWVGGGLLAGAGIYFLANSIHDFAVVDDPGEDRPRRQLAAEINLGIGVPALLLGAAGIGYATYLHAHRPTRSTRLPPTALFVPIARPGLIGIATSVAF